ncbi:DJ-1/PfpI family protein [Rhizobium sp. CCGE 510]|uniref:DJ-1/PfpI family protein n=1 Tax=Rhizobium sp. CCGE 510 TaxID=1132836 RepID=UPI00027B8924|nr:DJ-1/PfpI family protein [Rhizobium sp. CCGE 510]EJT01986.1 ThiJ/PfpI domain-containing protein [Rhizobium sp. CCGE 510]
MQHKVLIIIGDATETVDTLYPVLRVQEEGFQAVVAGPEKRRYNMVMHEHTEGWDITREWEGYKIDADIAFRDIDPSQYAGIFFSGGRAPEYIREDPDLIRVTQYFFEHNKPIASVCHGVEIPARAGCVKDRRMSCVPKCRFDLEVCGGIYDEGPICVDGNLVSAMFWNHHHLYMKTWIGLLEAEREKMRQRDAA